MGKYRKLLKNSSVFFIANFGSKLASFLLVRFYTEYLSTSEYGTLDLITATVSLVIPIITMCITEAVLRFAIDDIENRKKILSLGLTMVLLGNFIFIFSAPILYQFQIFRDNLIMLYLLTITNSLYMVTAHFSRGIGRSKVFAISGFLHTIIQIGANIIFLVGFSWGIKGYLLASVLANISSTIYITYSCHLKNFVTREIDRQYFKHMLAYAIPLIPNTLFWWIMQSADRYVILWMLSSAANGLYAAANKIPTLITTISSIFMQAWQLSSVEEASSDDKKDFYSKVFQILALVLICAASFIMVILQPLYHVFVNQAYYSGWQSVPFLLVATVFSCFSSFLGTNYVAMKQTRGAFSTTVMGAVVNMILNVVLTPIMGIIGTAAATAVAFFLTWLIRTYDTRGFVSMEYPVVTLILPLVILVFQSILLSIGMNSIYIQLVAFILILSMYGRTILNIGKEIVAFCNGKRNNNG